jgi:hypothetical protein
VRCGSDRNPLVRLFARSDVVTEDTYAADIERKTRKWA